MDYIEIINKSNELNNKKHSLLHTLLKLKKDINSIEKTCNHVNVYLGHSLGHSLDDCVSRCLFCGGTHYAENIINASEFLPQYDVTDPEQCQMKFEQIQTIALGILKTNKDITIEELIDKLNEIMSIEKANDNDLKNGRKFSK